MRIRILDTEKSHFRGEALFPLGNGQSIVIAEFKRAMSCFGEGAAVDRIQMPDDMTSVYRNYENGKDERKHIEVWGMKKRGSRQMSCFWKEPNAHFTTPPLKWTGSVRVHVTNNTGFTQLEKEAIRTPYRRGDCRPVWYTETVTDTDFNNIFHFDLSPQGDISGHMEHPCGHARMWHSKTQRETWKRENDLKRVERKPWLVQHRKQPKRASMNKEMIM